MSRVIASVASALSAFICGVSCRERVNVGKCRIVTQEMETPSAPKSTNPKKPVYVGNVETTGDSWTDVREATKVTSTGDDYVVPDQLRGVEVVVYRLFSH